MKLTRPQVRAFGRLVGSTVNSLTLQDRHTRTDRRWPMALSETVVNLIIMGVSREYVQALADRFADEHGMPRVSSAVADDAEAYRLNDSLTAYLAATTYRGA